MKSKGKSHPASHKFDALALVALHGSINKAAEAVGVSRWTMQAAYKKAGGKTSSGVASASVTPQEPKQHVTVDVAKDTGELSSCSRRITSLNQLLAATKVDLSVWEVERHVINKWEVGMKEKASNGKVSAVIEPLWQIKVWLVRKAEAKVAAETILDLIKKNAPLLPLPQLRKKSLVNRRALEVDIMDPHIGLLCQFPEADHAWNIDMAAEAIMLSIDDLIEKAMEFGPFEQVFLPFGNDFVHTDTVFHTTTAGTGQPEAIAWHHVYERAQAIAVEMVKKLRQVAKEIYIYEIPGNHSRMADYTIAQLLRAYFHTDPGVHVNCDSSPYKFHRFGTNLIGFEHGHSVSQIRLAALMANECRSDFAETQYHEFHLGDQHRKGSSKPAALEEQGVSVEFIPGLTAPNEWHRLKAFNHQKQGAMAFVYDFTTGPIGRFQHNLFKYKRNHLILK